MYFLFLYLQSVGAEKKGREKKTTPAHKARPVGLGMGSGPRPLGLGWGREPHAQSPLVHMLFLEPFGPWATGPP